jgi:hypothetical protein
LQARVAEAREHLGIFVDRIDRFQEEVDALASTPLSDSQAKGYFREVFDIPGPRGLLGQMLEDQSQRTELMRELLAAHAERTERQRQADAKLLDQLLAGFNAPENNLPGVQGTVWSALNAVTALVDHEGRGSGTDGRLNSIWFGDGNAVKQKAFTQALMLAGVA